MQKPPIIARRSTADSARIADYYPPLVMPRAPAIDPKIQATFANAYRAAITSISGTDVGVYGHGYDAKEFEYMVEAGMPAKEANPL